MHATIALCLMMVGGPLPPEPEITSVPLREDLSAINAIQDLEWKERVKIRPLPSVPTVADSDVQRDVSEGRSRIRMPGAPTDPNAQLRRQQQGTMPTPPTEAGELTTTGRSSPVGPLPNTPGSGGYNNNPGNTTSGVTPNRPSTYDPNAGSLPGQRPVNAGYGGYSGAQTTPSRATVAPTVANAINGSLGGNYGIYGSSYSSLPSNPLSSSSVGGDSRPFSDYQRPNGYSPWMSLYSTPTNNGTVSTYANTVQPQVQQQQFNQQVSEQIQGMRTMQGRPMNSGTPGTEMPVNGAGMTNPNAFLNYGGYYPGMNH